MKDLENDTRLPNYIRIHRRRTGLSQRDISHILGYSDEDSIRRHERLRVTPPLRVAIKYELLFRIPISELFAGLRDEVAVELERKVMELEELLGQQSTTDRNALATARKLMWLSERRNTEVEYVP
jgi:DNA-binding XRE family transcriptional regulator